MISAAAYRPVLAVLREDLLARSQEPSVRAMLDTAWRKESTAQRTADPFEVWCRGRATQVAAAWVLSVVFVRTLEDRGYLARRRIAGEGADDSEQQFVSVAPFLSARDYLMTVFREVARLPGAGEIFDARHNPVWVFGPSAEAARKLIDFFRQVDEHGGLKIRYEAADTRFLGDLYQDLDEDVRSRYALLQTPDFVEAFILGETLDPAIRTFGLKETKLIDPTCGSGHFLLGAFHRLLAGWKDEEPGTDVKVLAQRALSQVFGTDLNPYAVAIARFRLTLAFLRATGIERLRDAPPLHLNLAVADSLLHGRAETQLGLAHAAPGAGWGEDLFALEDEGDALRILGQRYEAVVGNPPYITVKDASLRDKYRELYKSCHRGYSLVAPFMERFFDLARDAGYIGAIVGNAFMKREFGSKLIEEVFPLLELTKVVDTSGAYIPGHGTPTAIVFGRRQRPGSAPVLAVMGKHGEPSTPEDPARGFVWSSIRNHHGDVGFENEFVSVAEIQRSRLAKHPWTLGGGGRSELKAILESRATTSLSEHIEAIGRTTVLGEDDIYIMTQAQATRLGLEGMAIPFVIGEVVRDWSIQPPPIALYPYSGIGGAPLPEGSHVVQRHFWPYRTLLNNRSVFGKTMTDKGCHWYEHLEHYRDKLRTPLAITFAFVATHNHFVLDRGGRIFNRSAPVIKLPQAATEEDHLALVAYLNSSAACFWMKQVCHKMTNASQKHHTDPARATYQFMGTPLLEFPIPSLPIQSLAIAARQVEDWCTKRRDWISGTLMREFLAAGVHRVAALRARVTEGWRDYEEATSRAVYLQEEIDWTVYQLFGLCNDGDSLPRSGQVLSTPLGSRPFERDDGYNAGVSDRAKRAPERSSTPQAIPPHWEHRARHLEVPEIRILETREFKRAWRDTEANVDQVEYRARAESEWLLSYVRDVIEDTFAGADAPRTVQSMVAAVSSTARSPTLAAIAEYLGQEFAQLLEDQIAAESVPFLAAERYTAPGLEKRFAWESTWELQRREDAGERTSVPVPPKYDQKDFRAPAYWSHRGKYDVRRERFISYPGCESDDDPSPLIGWAGWDHLQQAQALAALYQRRKDEDGWGAERLTPILAGLLELVPWLKQWHNEPDERFGGACAGDSFNAFVGEQARQLRLTLEDLRAWRPAQSARGRAKKVPTEPKPKANGLVPDAVVEAVRRLADAGDGSVAQTALAEALAVSSAAVGKIAATLVAQGRLEQLSARPKKYRIAQSAGSTGDAC